MMALTCFGLLAVEIVVFAGNGTKCPLTALAVSYGAEKGCAFENPPARAGHTTQGSILRLSDVGGQPLASASSQASNGRGRSRRPRS